MHFKSSSTAKVNSTADFTLSSSELFISVDFLQMCPQIGKKEFKKIKSEVNVVFAPHTDHKCAPAKRVAFATIIMGY